MVLITGFNGLYLTIPVKNEIITYTISKRISSFAWGKAPSERTLNSKTQR